jgi:enterochelin esterase-like enzyme
VRFFVLPLPGYSKTYGAEVVRYRLRSGLLERSLSEVAVVPPGGGRRPLLVLLHGRHDARPWSWLLPSRAAPETLLSNSLFEALHRLGNRAPVVVMLNGGDHSYYHDRADGAWGSMILEEAIPDAQRRFRTIPRRAAIGGISMGGYGALHSAARRQASFCAVGGHSAALWERAGDTAPGAFDDARDFGRNDVFPAARNGRLDRIPIWLDVGADDPFRAADTALAALLRRKGAEVTFHVWPGGHAGAYWHAHMATYLAFYARALSRCAVTSRA